MSFPWDSSPKFIAPSYVWGDEDDSRSMVLDGHLFVITNNLHSALLAIATDAALVTDFYFWIDAICINQADIDERSTQVPRMADIYSPAYSVFGWLGNTGHLGADVGLLFEEVTSHGKLYDELRQFLDEGFSFPWETEQLTRKHRTSLRDFILFWFVLDNDDSGNHDSTPLELLQIYHSRRLVHSGSPSSLPSAAHALIVALFATIDAQSKLAHDRIYGTLGLVGKFISMNNCATLPVELTPNYRQPFDRVCHQYAVYILQETRDLRLWRTFRRQICGVPSWVPDFRYASRIDTDMRFDLKAHLSFSFPGGEIDEKALRNRISEFESLIIAPSAARTNSSLEQTRQKWSDSASHIVRDGPTSCLKWYDELRLKAQLPDELLGSQLDYIGGRDHHDFTKVIYTLTKQHVLCEDGQIAAGYRQDAMVRNGDVLCRFRGAYEPSLLRPTGLPHEPYEYISQCRVIYDPLLDVDAHHAFFLEHPTTSFTLI
ncbi:Uu.00g069440.m01.CDS01 [Anthostomella pinea]|uniref:Uu.00g069440.m01.CDS01 n=1 Tax=Anthostomella pinea TaxID=933095 RepID=A0AAI8VUJ0_9PEZI|nr:Uu.00g069440.m01.CDS01 [Anthostomella pinea]